MPTTNMPPVDHSDQSSSSVLKNNSATALQSRFLSANSANSNRQSSSALSTTSPSGGPSMNHLTSDSYPTLQKGPNTLPKRLEHWTLFGHPHDQASPQETEPFWQQNPEVAFPGAHYYPEQDLYTLDPIYYASVPGMDTAPLIIGFKSRHGRSNTASTNTLKRPRELVKVYLDDEYVGEISLSVLTRFSKLAKAAFPRPEQAKGDSTRPEAFSKLSGDNLSKSSKGESTKSKSWAEMAEQGDDEHDTAEASVETEDVDKAASAAAQDQSVVAPVAIPEAEPKALDIGVPGAWLQPDISIAKHILNWMDQNKRSRHNEPLMPLTPAPLPKISLKALVDTYLGVLAYNLAPFPHDLRHEILTRLTQQPIQAAQMRYLYEHLPTEDPILSRMVTSFFEHGEANHYTQAEVDAIQKYVNEDAGDDGELSHHFVRVQRNRNRKQKREDAIEKLREGFENFAGPMHKALPEEPESAEDTKKAAQGAEQSGRRRNRREQQAKKDFKGQAKASTSKGKGKGKGKAS